MVIVLIALAAVGIGIYIHHWIKWLEQFLKADTAKRPVRIINMILTVALTVLSTNILNVTAVILLHFWVASMLTDAAVTLLRKVIKHPLGNIGWLRTVYRTSAIPLAVVIAVTCYGAYNMSVVRETRYTYVSDTPIREEGYRVALITDTHYGTVQDVNVLKNAIPEINALHPDIVLLGGDIVDENTSREYMEDVFSTLGQFESTYGTYYVYGNHDRQTYARDAAFSVEELDAAIEGNGITILRDEYTVINGEIVLVGREDRSVGNRETVDEILGGAGAGQLIMVLDHQPVEAGNNDASGVDVQLSGHTHAGQIWPVGLFIQCFSRLNYGHYEVGSCDVYISSGFAGWAYPIRTSEHCEYVILDILSGED